MTTEGREVYDRGWRQGSVIPLSAAELAVVDGAALGDGAIRRDMQLVLATQDCDLVKATERLPNLEAIGCFMDKAFAKEIRANDARYFVLDPAEGLIADRAVIVALPRSRLENVPIPSPPCGGDARRCRRFAIWLGARYDRPALPDAAVEHLQRPLTEAVRKLCRPGKQFERLNADLHEVRVVGDLSGDPPLSVALLFIITEGASVESAELAIAEVIAEAGFVVEDVASDEELEGAAVHLLRWIAAPPTRLTLAAYLDSVPVPLEYESVRGEEIVGAEPLDAESM